MYVLSLLVFLNLLLYSYSVGANPLDRLVAHAHVRGGRLYGCPHYMCEMEPNTKLYFWIRQQHNAPNMFLQTRSTGQTLTITTKRTDRSPPLTRSLKMHLMTLARGDHLYMMEAEFPDNRMSDITYTFLMTNDYMSWLAADMICERHIRLFESFRRGTRLICRLDKRDWQLTSS